MDMTGVRLTELVEAAGCAAKIAPGELAGVLSGLPRLESDRLVVGFDASDDACVWDLGDGSGLVATTDFFPPMVDDPFLFGQVAATNALSDVYAMGGAPALALNLLCFPNCLGIEVAGEILAGGADACRRAGCVVAGGHSINDHEPKYGLAVTGFVDLDQRLENGGARAGDALVLTKALGTGILTTARKGGLLDEAGLAVATTSMATLNEAPIRLARQLGVWPHAATDVTGFSLMGHACEMAEASGVTLQIASADVPLMARAREMAAMGLVPAGAYRNRDFFGPRTSLDDALPLDLTDVLFDPQTSGGLLLALGEKDAERLVGALRDEGLPASVIGGAVERGESSVIVS
ncbi:MAG TPA: selenide, water dikinase SelD [Candidatus Olsenella pullistercoris]|uniref:Selenide, water dikinase n=1 Tax=Candidatus Olsenella pullistercoris TaxID=2838712 RepID=A0A9D2JDK3_9ACTN|nr:selenide, water dikinase SelD [Candidatus Olsenella pullistercoris]